MMTTRRNTNKISRTDTVETSRPILPSTITISYDRLNDLTAIRLFGRAAVLAYQAGNIKELHETLSLLDQSIQHFHARAPQEK